MDVKKLNEEVPVQYVSATVSKKYKLITPAAEPLVLPVDARRVEHGQGPCACCGPYSE